MTGPKRQKKGAMLWRWLYAVEELSRVDESLTTGQRTAIRLVATKRARAADSDGRNSYPSQETLAEFAGVKRVTVRFADGWLLRMGLMVLTRRSGRRVSRRYRLELPALEDGSDGDHLVDEKMGPQRPIQDQLDDPLDGPLDGPLGDHNRLPPKSKTEEEEEGAVARSADAPLAAPSEPDLFSDDWRPPDQSKTRPSNSSSLSPELFAEARYIADDIAEHTGVPIDPGRCRLAEEMLEARSRTGWNDSQVAIYCVELLDRMKRRGVNDATALLATDFRTRVTESTTASPRMKWAGLLNQLWDLDDAAPVDVAGPVTRFDTALRQAELLSYSEEFIPAEWDADPAWVEKAVPILTSVLNAWNAEQANR